MDVSDAMQQQAKALADPSRFRLFRHIVAADGPVGVAELTELLGFNHNAIRQHLAQLRDAALIAETNEDRTVRGRPRKQYHARADALSAFRSISGSYEQLARLLLQLATSDQTPYQVGRNAADLLPERTESRSPVGPLVRQLAVAGFEPTVDGSAITLHNCPFADIAAVDQDIICELHRGLIDGGLAGFDKDLRAALSPRAPRDAGCRVTIGVD